MPKINTIAIVPVPKLSDKLVGTSVGGTPVNQTNNFTLQQLKNLFDGTPTSPTLQAVLNAGNTATQNIYLTGTIDTVNLDVSNDSFLKNLYLSERLFDRNNFQGTSGQYLTSTGTGVQWSTLTIATPTLQQVLTAGNISDKNIITTGNIQAANIEGTNITANTNLRVVGTLSDSSNSVGGSGQVLSSTVTGTDWIDFPSYSAVSPLIYNNILKQFSIQVATSTQNGYLSSADWITFNGKQNAGNYITALTGEASALGPGSVNITLNNLAVINKTLTGLAIASGVITAADSIITAFGKIQGQINGIVAGVVYQGVWNAATNTPTLTSSVGVQGHYYVVDVAGNTNLNGITDWQVGDWAIYNGTAWQKVDNTDSVTSVNGQTGIVVLNSDDIAEGTTNLYYLDSRARAAISSVATGLTYTSATGVFSLTAGYSIPTVANQTNWTTAYNDSIVSAAVTGTTTKTLTLTQQDGGTITASWTDIDTNLVTSVFGRTGAVVAQSGDYSTTLVTEGTNLYYLDSRARNAISSSATGLTYTTATGVFSFTAGYSIPTDASQSNWTTAYNDSITSAAVTGTTTKTLTLNQQDGGTITASWTDLDTGLTSVGVSMPSAFNVTNSPLTSNGTIAVTGAGTASQYVRGDGTLGDFPTGGGGGGASVSYYLNGSINQGTFGGNTYYQMSKTPILGTGTDFSTSTNGYIAQFITDVGTPDALLIPGGNWNFETYFSASSGGGSPTFYIELYKYDGATFTLIASNSSNPELIAFGTTINPYYNSLAVPETILLATDRLAIRIYVFTSGRTITLHTENSHLCQVITTFTTGLTALNGLTKQIQYFAVGTSGTDFNISSSVATHTFNLPTASAVNRGALSAANWTTFNNKLDLTSLLTGYTVGPNTPIAATDSLLTAFGELQGQINARVSGTIATGQVAFGTNANTIGGNSGVTGLTYDNSNSIFRAVGVSISFNGANRLINTHSDAGRLILNGGVLGGSVNNPEIQIGSVSNLNSIDFRTNNSVRWSILSTGQLQSNGAQTIQTSTGNLTLATAAANGNIVLSPNGVGVINLIGQGIAGIANLLNISAVGNGGSGRGTAIVLNAPGSASSVQVARIVGYQETASATANNASFAIQVANSSATLTEYLRIFNTGNLVLQNGGTFTDAGFRLDVNGTTRLNGLQTFQGTTASDTAPLGSELATTGSGTNWTGTDFATGYTHVVGSTASLTTSLAAVVSTFYQITYTVTGRTAGSFTINYGGTSTTGLTATGATGPLATSTATLEIVPTTDFNGTIVLSVRTIGTSSATTTFNDSSANARIEVRATSATNNTILGRHAGRRTTTGNNNSLFGFQSGQNITTSTNNSFFGFNSGINTTTGGNNSFFGSEAGGANTTGGSNSFFGIQAGQNNTTGANNTCIGDQAARNLTTGIFNTNIGSIAGRDNTTGSRNVFVGREAGTFLANGTTPLTIANNSVFLGNQTRANADNETNQIVIGHTAIGLGSNTTVIGNSSTTFGRWFGNLLIGTSTNVASSIFTMSSTTQGFLPPRMTSTERNAIATPATGLMVYNTTDNRPSFYNGTSWINL